MQVLYFNKKVATVFEDYAIMQSKIGLERTRAIKKHIYNIKAANNFSIFLSVRIGNPHQLKGVLKKCYGITVTGNVRLIIEPQAEDFSVECFNLCEIVKVKGVCDYHGKKEEWIIS